MAGERNVVKDNQFGQVVFDFKPRELTVQASQAAKDFVSNDSKQSEDFQISDLVAKQVGISKLESDANEDQINARVVERMNLIEEKAYKEGYDLGLLDGSEKAFQESKEELEKRITVLDNVLSAIETQRQRVLIDNEEQFIGLVFQIAKKIAMRDLSEHRDAVIEILRHVTEEMSDDEKITAHVSAEDLQFVQTIQERSGQKLDKIKKVKLIEDDKILSGGCILETAFGSVDATIEERVERTWQIVKNRVPQKRSGAEG